MSASRTKKERQQAALSGLSEKEKKEQLEAKKKHRNHIIYLIAGIVAVICVAALLIWDSGVVQKNLTAVTVGSRKYKPVDVDYYYSLSYSNYSQMASVYGIEVEVDDEMEANLRQSAVASLTSISVLAQEAEAAGYTLSDEGKESVETALDNVASYATLYGTTTEGYLRASYGQYMTEKDFRRINSEINLAQEYADVKVKTFEPSEEEINTYYSEHTGELDSIDYTCYLVSFDRTETDADGNSVDLDEATIELNRTQAAAQAQSLLEAMQSGDEDSVAELAATYGALSYSNVPVSSYYPYYDFLNDSSNKAGAATVIADNADESAATGYFALLINDRSRDEYHGVDARVIRMSATADDEGNYDMDALTASVQAVLDEYESGDHTEEAFAALADANSTDAASYPGGLHENVSKQTYNDDVNEWLFASSRTAGETTLIVSETSHTAYILYYVGQQAEPYWRTAAVSALQEQKYSEWLETTTEGYTVTEGSGLSYVPTNG